MGSMHRGAAAPAVLIADHARAQAFFGGTPADPVNAVAVYACDDVLYYVDFAEEPLGIYHLADSATLHGRSISVSPDGRFVAYARAVGSARDIYIRRIEAGTTEALRVNGTMPTWWVHPVTRKIYWVYQNGYAMYMQQIDLDAFRTIGEPSLLVEGHTSSADSVPMPVNGGRSADGRFMTGDDRLHGMVELADPLATGFATVKTYVRFTSYLGWQDDWSHLVTHQEYAGWCNANISPATSASSQFYGCVQHLGSGHREIFIRRWPADLYNTGDMADTNACVKAGVHFPPTSCCAPDQIVMRLEPKDGNSHFHGGFWSTHEHYIVTKVGNAVRDTTWYGHIYDISSLTDANYLAFLSKNLDQTHDFIHLWVEDRSSSLMHRNGARHRGDAAVPRLVCQGNKGLTVRLGATGRSRVALVDLRGRTVGRVLGATQAAKTMMVGQLSPGVYMLKVERPTDGVIDAVLPAR